MRTAILLVITTALFAGTLYGQNSEQPPPAPSQEQPEVLTSGPVHEAFAKPVNLQNQSGVAAPSAPPANIDENLPNYKPTGSQLTWVPGYWAWDTDRRTYIWVSGCWRAAPPDRYWVPGYWYKTAGGYEWVAGFWAPLTSASQLEYLPTPPPIENVEAPGPPPSVDNVWIQPCWYWSQNGYIWRSGYWMAPQQGWVWVPSHYIWTPRGYLFDSGHWDYSLDRRGVLFTPYYIPRAVYERHGFSLSLGVVVDLGLLELNLFTYPRYCHYYFGDYYDESYISIGIFPQFDCDRIHTWYDPLYVHNRWRHHETSLVWEQHQRHEFELRRADKSLRPPRTYHDMEDRMARLPESRWKDFHIAEHFTRVVADKKAPLKFEPIKANDKQKLLNKATGVRQFREYRNNMESRPAEKKLSGTQPTERKVTPAAPTEHRGGFTNRESDLSRSERVDIPSPPISNKQGLFSKGPPSRPSSERRTDSTKKYDDNTEQGNKGARENKSSGGEGGRRR